MVAGLVLGTLCPCVCDHACVCVRVIMHALGCFNLPAQLHTSPWALVGPMCLRVCMYALF